MRSVRRWIPTLRRRRTSSETSLPGRLSALSSVLGRPGNQAATPHPKSGVAAAFSQPFRPRSPGGSHTSDSKAMLPGSVKRPLQRAGSTRQSGSRPPPETWGGCRFPTTVLSSASRGRHAGDSRATLPGRSSALSSVPSRVESTRQSGGHFHRWGWPPFLAVWGEYQDERGRLFRSCPDIEPAPPKESQGRVDDPSCTLIGGNGTPGEPTGP